MKTSTFVLASFISIFAAATTACGGSAGRTAYDPSAAEIAAHQDEDPTMPNKVVDLKSATAFAGEPAAKGGAPIAAETASK